MYDENKEAGDGNDEEAEGNKEIKLYQDQEEQISNNGAPLIQELSSTTVSSDQAS